MHCPSATMNALTQAVQPSPSRLAFQSSSTHAYKQLPLRKHGRVPYPGRTPLPGPWKLPESRLAYLNDHRLHLLLSPALFTKSTSTRIGPPYPLLTHPPLAYIHLGVPVPLIDTYKHINLTIHDEESKHADAHEPHCFNPRSQTR